MKWTHQKGEDGLHRYTNDEGDGKTVITSANEKTDEECDNFWNTPGLMKIDMEEYSRQIAKSRNLEFAKYKYCISVGDGFSYHQLEFVDMAGDKIHLKTRPGFKLIPLQEDA